MKFSNQYPNLMNHFLENNKLEGPDRHYTNFNNCLPSVNIKEDADAYILDLAAPGYTKSEFDIKLNNNTLTISSEKKQEDNAEKDEKYTTKEFSFKSFKRSFTLPLTVDREQISASYENGILSLSIPKKEEAKPKPEKQIDIA